MKKTSEIDPKTKFIRVPQKIIETANLDAIEKVLYIYLFSLEADEQAFPDYKRLMEVTGIRSRTTMSKKLKILQTKGLLNVEATYLDNGFKSRNNYKVEAGDILLIDEKTIQVIAQQLQQIFVSLAYELSEQEVLEIAKTGYIIYGDQAYRELMIQVANLGEIGMQKPFAVLSARLERIAAQIAGRTMLEQLLFDTFPTVTSQDRITFKRLCETYPEPLIQFTLESVRGKAKQTNWAYITATLKKLVQTCQTYQDCVEQTKQFFAKKDAQIQNLKADQKQKHKLVMRLIQMDCFGEIGNPLAYIKTLLADEKYQSCTSYELFEMLTGWDHLHAFSYDQEIFYILYPPQRPEYYDSLASS
ncbi:MAG: helix-turn-helix domain-containing protein [Culicoidibacterales bacterium]